MESESKYDSITLPKFRGKFINDVKSLIINIVENDLSQDMELCKEKYFLGYLTPDIILTACTYGSIKCLEITNPNIHVVPWSYPELPKIDENNDSDNNDSDNMQKLIHQCVLMSIKHKNDTAIFLLQWITKNFQILHPSTFREILKFADTVSIDNMISKWQMCKNEYPKECDEEILLLLFLWQQRSVIVKIYFLNFDFIKYKTCMKIIKDELFKEDSITRIILMKLIQNKSIEVQDIPIIIELVTKFNDEEVIGHLFNSPPNINMEIKKNFKINSNTLNNELADDELVDNELV
jgi:hypothetical protein